jgi:hypothetical protein
MHVTSGVIGIRFEQILFLDDFICATKLQDPFLSFMCTQTQAHGVSSSRIATIFYSIVLYASQSLPSFSFIKPYPPTFFVMAHGCTWLVGGWTEPRKRNEWCQQP